MHDTAAILGRATVAYLLAVAGGLASVLLGVSHQRLCALISLAAGTLTGVTVCAILPETVAVLRWWELAVACGSGYLVFSLISRYVFHVCPACAASHFDEATTHRFSEIAAGLIVALAIHSTMDGVAVAAGHEAREATGQLDLSLLLAVCVHKVPEGLALGALLLGAGFRRGQTLGWVAAVEATTLLGAGLGRVGLQHVSIFWIDAILAHVGGGFVFLAVHAVFGELVKHSRRAVLGNFIAGVALIAALNLVMHFW